MNLAVLLENQEIGGEGKTSHFLYDEVHGRCEELGVTTSRNPSVYGERYVLKVNYGTGETLTDTEK